MGNVTRLSLVMSLIASFCAIFFPTRCLGWDLGLNWVCFWRFSYLPFFISLNYYVWSTFSLINIFIAFEGKELIYGFISTVLFYAKCAVFIFLSHLVFGAGYENRLYWFLITAFSSNFHHKINRND